MTDLSKFDANGVSNPKNNIFGLPFSEDEARLIILPVPWEVTVSYGAGTSRAPEHIFIASMQVDIFDADCGNAWRKGFYMRPHDRKLLMKSDYLRKEAELYIDYISKDELVEKNTFMTKSLKEINEGGANLNVWVYEQTRELLKSGKLVGLLGGDHSVPFGFYKAIAETYGDFGILHIDAHCDLRKSYADFTYSHASVMYNALNEIPEVKKIVQVGVRDYSQEEWDFICKSDYRLVTYFDKEVKERMYDGQTWKQITDEMIGHLPDRVYVSFDIDGLDPKLCPHTGTPVQGGYETEQVLYLIKKISESGRQFIGFDLVEVGTGESDWDANVGAHVLWKLCNMLVAANS
ncbi:MAG TPA: agmatinase family protein [Puia sp.]|nr:agmatinase family protein [Puia sp.]